MNSDRCEPRVAALYVQKGGVYSNVCAVDPWDESRDARCYAGPDPVIAHPPCKRWGRYWGGGPSAKVKRKLGDDGGCFAAALDAVRKHGGVLEHPEASHAFKTFGLNRPPHTGGWVPAGDGIGYVACVEQGNYGHPARKKTWLYAAGCDKEHLPELKWGPSKASVRLDVGYHSAEERRQKAGTAPKIKRIPHRVCEATPPEFRDALLAIVRSCVR